MIEIKTVLRLLIGVSVIVSCQRIDEFENNQSKYSDKGIVFTSSYTTSRAVSGIHNGWKENEKVGIMAYCHAENQGVNLENSPWDTKKDFVTPDIFYNQPLTFNGSGLWDYNWDGKGLHPWLENEKAMYTFIAYYPYSPLTDGSSSNNRESEIKTEDDKNLGLFTFSGDQYKGEPTLSYTVPYSQNGTASDPLESFLMPDFMLAVAQDRLQGNGVVDLSFEHMFAGLEFEINNYVIDKSIVIQSIEFVGDGFYRNIKINGTNKSNYEVTKNDLYSGTFIVAKDVQVLGATGNPDNGQIVPSHQRIDGTLFFISDEQGMIVPNGKNCSVKITLSGKDPVIMPLSTTTFSRGIKTIFSINYVGDDFVIQVRSDNSWEIGGDNDITFD